MTDDSQGQVGTLNDALAAGFETADFEALKALYTEDAVLLPPRSRAIKGRQAIAAFWTGVRNRFSGMTFTTGEWKALGDAVARETGTYEMAGGEGGGTRGVGKFMMVWQKIDGAWQVESSIWSINPSLEARRPGQGAGAGAGAQGRGGQGGRQGSPGGGQRQGGQGGGYRQQGGGGQGGYGGGQRRGGIGGGAGVGGGGAGVIGAGRRGGQAQGGQREAGGGPGQNRRAQSLYDDNPGLYSNQDD